MVIKTLLCHPNTPCAAAISLYVAIDPFLHAGIINLSYKLAGDFTRICIPPPKAAAPADGLWQHTCFEAFIAGIGEAEYYEFNFSPSGQWAAYAFSDYRVRNAWTINQALKINFYNTDDTLVLDAVIASDNLPSDLKDKPLQLGLSAVLEANDGTLSYWALQHPRARPDFHDRAGFEPLIKQQ